MTPADLDRVLQIADSLPQAPRWAREMYETALNPESAPPRIALVALDSEGQVVGFLVASLVLQQAELETIGVVAGRQRQGIGRALTGQAEEILAVRGATTMILEVRESNAAAQQLYRSRGFEPLARRGSYYIDPKEDAIIMSLDLVRERLSHPPSDNLDQ